MSSPTGHRRVDSPLELRHIDFTFDNDHLEKSAAYLVKTLFADWDADVHFVRFTNGITNTLTKATKQRPGRSKAETDEDAVLIRAYGKGTDAIIDREREVRAHNLLANLGLAPPLLARFNNGLMYRFIPGEVCSYEDLSKPHIYRAVAKRLGQWHGILPISSLTTTPNLHQESPGEHAGNEGVNQTRPVPNTWSVVQQWIEQLPTTTEAQKTRNETLRRECVWLSEKLGSTPGLDGKDYIFGHCDVLCGNVIVQRPSETSADPNEERPVHLIDYEYATPSAAAFDIANHFAEWAGYDCDHASVPTRSQRRDFLKHYVGSFRFHSISDDNQTIEVDFQKDIDTLYDQVDTFRGVPGFYWGIWALIQATISELDFDYESYAKLRLSEYWGWKAEMDGSRAKAGREMTVREKRWAEE